MTMYIIRSRRKPHTFWLARGAGTDNTYKSAYRFTRKEVEAIAREYPDGWFKTCLVVIPVGVP